MAIVTIIGIATFEISRPIGASQNVSEDEREALTRVRWIQHSTSIACAAMSFSGSKYVQATGLDCRFDKVFVRLAVPSDMDVETLPALGEELAKAFYAECGLDAEEERKLREVDGFTRPLWSVHREPLTKD